MRVRCGCRVRVVQPSQTVEVRQGTDRVRVVQLVGRGAGIPFEGPYDVIPRLFAQEFQTSGKVMREDLTVEGIPNYRTTNPSGGYTVVIAQD